MPHITRALIRKRAEHNEGIISTLEEISLHQEELESISEVLGTTCRKLKILYLQNNIIGKMENLHHMKELEYLNLALNNIDRIQGLDRCEFLNKLDLTVNFIDFDALEDSMTCLSKREHLTDLYMMGNPCQMDWEEGFEQYCIHRLPQLRCLDGKDITKSMRIVAAQHFPRLEAELREKAVVCREKKAIEAVAKKEAAAAKAAEKEAKMQARAELEKEGVVVEDDTESEEETEHTPENRVDMYKEIAEEKAEKEAREREREPRKRDYEQEQKDAIERTRKLEEEGRIRQCNEGKWVFSFDETGKHGSVVLDVSVPKFLDSSLIDVDVHPNYVSIVIKSKVLRLNLPAEVDSSNSSAARSKTTGHLVLTMPKIHPEENSLGLRVAARNKEKAEEENKKAIEIKQKERNLKNLSAQMQVEAMRSAKPAGGAVKLKGLVPARKGGLGAFADQSDSMKAVSTKVLATPPPPPPAAVPDDDDIEEEEVDEDEPPPLF